MAITTTAQLNSALRAAVQVPFNRTGQAYTVGAGWRNAYWFQYSSTSMPNIGSVGTATTFDSSSAGAMPIPAALAAGNSWYLAGVAAVGSAAGGSGPVTLADRHAQTGWLPLTTTSTQPVTLTLPSRVDTSDTTGPQVFLEMHGTSTTAINPVTISYTNSSGVAGRTGTLPGGMPVMPTSNSGYCLGPFRMQAGDVGIRSVESLTLGTTGTGTGQLMLVFASLITAFNVREALGETRLSWADLGLPRLHPSPCLYWIGSSNLVSTLMSTLTLVQG